MMNNFSYKDMENLRSSHSLIDLNLIKKAEQSNGISSFTGGILLMII